ncbi:hypothetical protein EGR_08808 [Echinococcus granulosus]|uniref:Uncharacterized protein n=1 Tax=Echinococcus granulosus TaxID=6210 RepID=W6U587_ECHGR|nr:hypothetical protein EGR_08808 [Echinococcus granulosus]EUB56333.1 hypothetical protein EGR_08808 [Echinococcus granulosus]
MQPLVDLRVTITYGMEASFVVGEGIGNRVQGTPHVTPPFPKHRDVIFAEVAKFLQTDRMRSKGRLNFRKHVHNEDFYEQY